MKIIHIYQKKSDNNDNNSELSNKINEIKSSIKNQTPIFMLLHSEKCGHCIKMLPNWRQLKHSDEIKEKRNHPFLIVDIEHKMIEKLKDEELNEDLKLDNIVGYPTIIQIHKGKIEPYEESGISLKDRSTDSFIEWIESKLEEHNIREKNTTPETVDDTEEEYKTPKTLDDTEEEYKTPKEYKTPEIILDDTEEETKKLEKKDSLEQKGGRKWSSKYKKSINCKRPRGFSQRQYCKYGRGRKSKKPNKPNKPNKSKKSKKSKKFSKSKKR